MPILRRTILALPLATPALAQSGWPDRPVKIIVPFPPGQAADVVTRVVADLLSQRWPQRVVVENRGGGAGAPAMEVAARSAPDGYTLVAGTSGTLGVNPSVLPNIPYDAEKDFAPISNIAIIPLMIVAHPSHPANTAQDVVRLARAAPGGMDIATAGPATSQHLAAELFALRTGAKLNMVHYRGSGPGVTDLIAGNVTLMMDSFVSARPHLAAGRLKAIAVTTETRIPQLPAVPSIAETVAPGYRAFGWTGLCAPAATPAAVVRKVNADVTAILREPAVVQRIIELGGTAAPTTPEAFGAFVHAEIAQWREIVRLANVKLEG